MESGYWDDFDDNTKYQLGRQALEPLAAFASGSIKENRDDDKVYFGGKYLDRTFRVLIDMSWGKPKLEAKVANDKGYLYVDFDLEKKPQDADPDWDNDTKPRFFLAPGAYIEDSQEDLDRQRAMLGGLAPALVVQLWQQTNARSFGITAEGLLEVDFDDLITSGPIVQRMQVACDLIAQILREMKLS